MTARVERTSFRINGVDIPAYVVIPEKAERRACALYIHGYASSKEDGLGLAIKLAENGVEVFSIDLRGHGESDADFTEDVVDDVRALVEVLREKCDKVVAIGHSLGGLLAILSNADYAIAISPPLMPKVADEPKFMLKLSSQCLVRESDENVLFKILEKFNPPPKRPATVIYGEGESDAVKSFIAKWASAEGSSAVEVKGCRIRLPDVHIDFEKLARYLPYFTAHRIVKQLKETQNIIVDRIKSLIF